MIGPTPSHRPLNEWEARVNAAWIISHLCAEADECMQIILSNQPLEKRMRACDRRNACYRLIAGYDRLLDRSAA